MQERTGRRTAYLLMNWCGNEKPDLNRSWIVVRIRLTAVSCQF